ncbi:ABC transporter substrate-binding protein [Leisingera sp. M658]|uniref:ABC transporter substrate-binding protein n=1 Tax=Leisingera sp. M658 TaxID=2867015 RepID=UPI0038FC409E
MPAGYVPLTDAAPLIAAQELGVAAEQQLTLELHRAPSWPRGGISICPPKSSIARCRENSRSHLRARSAKRPVSSAFMTTQQPSPGGARCNGLPYSPHSGTAWAARRHLQRPCKYFAAICTATPCAGPAPACPASL